MRATPDVARATPTSARRRRERRIRSFFRHEQMAVQMAVVSAQHHSAQRCCSIATQTDDFVPAATYAATASPAATAASPMVEYVDPAPFVAPAAPAPVFEHMAPAPVIENIAPVPAVTLDAPSQQLPPVYTMATVILAQGLSQGFVSCLLFGCPCRSHDFCFHRCSLSWWQAPLPSSSVITGVQQQCVTRGHCSAATAKSGTVEPAGHCSAACARGSVNC